MQKLLKELEGKESRMARFRTVISLIWEGQEYFFEGIVEGVILSEKRGEEGFGYDPIFQPDGYDRSFAQLTMQEKNEISHRGRAVQKLLQFLQSVI
jgi:XTP/dITP diphosphohydrolase